MTMVAAFTALLGADLQAAPGQPQPALEKTPVCGGPELQFVQLAPDLWWIPAGPGGANAANQGHVSNLLVAVQAQRIWLLGSGPAPAFGQTLACRVRQHWGRPVTDVISPWPHPEAVLGVAGMGAVRHWAHAEVATAMKQRCPFCVARLREQLGQPTGLHNGLDSEAVRLPQRLLHGPQGRLGPWRWWQLSRGPGAPVTVWQWGDAAVRSAPGLLWADGAPDARDADVRALARATYALAALAGSPAAPVLWLGEQGPPSNELLTRHQRYWDDLLREVQALQLRGALETAAPVAPALLPANDARHALNWQRAWRQLEADSFQRSLR